MQQPEPERGMVIRGPDSSGMRIWVISLGKSYVSRGAEGEGNPDRVVGMSTTCGLKTSCCDKG